MRPDFIETFTGKRFRPLAPNPELIDITDIGHSLSHQCRFSGHTLAHYSVGQHSCIVSQLVKEHGGTREEQLWGLLHDASEAYLVDIPSPLKSQPEFAGYLVAEKALMHAVCEFFGLPYDEPEIVRKCDGIALATEARDLMPYRAEHWAGLVERPHPYPIVPWTTERTRHVFARRYEELSRWR